MNLKKMSNVSHFYECVDSIDATDIEFFFLKKKGDIYDNNDTVSVAAVCN